MMKKIFSMTLASVAVFYAAIYGLYRWGYPFGDRACLMPCTMMALRTWANGHAGWFPKDAATPLQSLQLLYPNYLPADNLAGISGDTTKAERRFQQGQPLDESVSSWIYFPGFREDDAPGDGSPLAIIWERKGGISFNGRRADRHAVGFVEGSNTQVMSDRWPAFLKEQEAVRAAVLVSRNSTNATIAPPKSAP